MALGRPIPPITLSPELRQELQGMIRAHSLSQALAQRARIILLADNGLNNTTIARQLKLSNHCVGKWRRFLAQGLAGLYDEPRLGGPRDITDEEGADLIDKTLRAKPKDATHWTVRGLATETKLSKSTVHRLWRAFALQPHRQKHFKLSTDPFFIEKV